MLKMLTSSTYEIDDVEAAVQEVLAQLNLPENLLPNAVGMIHCYPDFIESGVVRALCDAVPFEVVGGTSIGFATGDEAGDLMLSFSVFTADDTSFATACADGLSKNPEEKVAAAYQTALAALPGGEVKLVMAFAPLVQTVGGEALCQALDTAAKGAPVFGTIACDQHSDYHETYAIHNGQHYREGMSFILMAGQLNPRFYSANISPYKIQKQKAVITEVEGNRLIGVNGLPFVEYMETLGLRAGENLTGMTSIPFLVDYKDGTRPIARAFYTLDEEGAGICSASMPKNGTLAIGSLDVPDVLQNARELATEVRDVPHQSAAILFSCLSRSNVLGADTTAELNIVRQVLAGQPYALCYSGGEFCPLYLPGGETVNRFHNYTFIACVL